MTARGRSGSVNAKRSTLRTSRGGRVLKAVDIVEDGPVRERILVAYAEERGKRRAEVHASVKAWREVWRLLHDRETHGATATDPFANLPGGGY